MPNPNAIDVPNLGFSEEQSAVLHIGYLDRFGLDVGYMLSFNFKKSKKIGVERIVIKDKTLFEGTL